MGAFGQSGRGARGDLARRVASAMALGPLAFGLAALGGPWLDALAATVGLLAYREWAALSRRVPMPRATSAGGAAYIATAALSLAWLGSAGAPHAAAPWLLAVVWASDVGGYVVGRGLRGPKLAPRVSPGKTWSGLAGAVAFAAAAGWAGAEAGCAVAPAAWAAALGAVLGLVGQAGDLLESALKRAAGAKDSGTLIPGHGGVLDRVDALMAAAIALAAVLVMLP